jgi:hypothetical protein
MSERPGVVLLLVESKVANPLKPRRKKSQRLMMMLISLVTTTKRMR